MPRGQMLILINYIEGSAHDNQGPEGGSVTGDHPALRSSSGGGVWVGGGGSAVVFNVDIHLMKLKPCVPR